MFVAVIYMDRGREAEIYISYADPFGEAVVELHNYVLMFAMSNRSELIVKEEQKKKTVGTSDGETETVMSIG